MAVDKWIEETISGVKLPEKRLLGPLLEGVKMGDIIICSELSRLGRNMFMIMSILNFLIENGVKIWTIKENYRLGDNIEAKILAFAFGMLSEIERVLISQRTKEALVRKRAEGVVLGRPRGSKSAQLKLLEHEAEILTLVSEKVSKSAISRKFNVSRKTIISFIKSRFNPSHA
jgi:DNA invertase Pin-like site-specific DNA recombinase